MTLNVSTRRVFAALIALIVVLFLAHLGGQFSEHILGHPSLKGSVPLFNMNAELGIPAWISSLLLLTCSLLLAGIALSTRDSGAPYTWSWILLSLAFAYVALDEAVAIHEMTIAPLREMMGVTEGWLFFAWVTPGAFAVGVLGVLLLPLFRSLPRRTMRSFAIAAAIYLTGALAVEAAGGW